MRSSSRSSLRWRLVCFVVFLCLAGGLSALEGKPFKVIIVMDTVDTWSAGIRDGFRESLDKQLASAGKSATYQVFDSKLDPGTIPGIQAAIDATKPDLICTINYPTVFADNMITKLPANASYKFVSENCIPIQSGLIKDVKKPGGNVTGVGVFTQVNSVIRLAKMINPRVKKSAWVSWDAMTQVNEWFEDEIKRACKEEGIEFTEFRKVSCLEDEIAFYAEYDKKGKEYFVSGAISAWVHRDGTAANAGLEIAEFSKKNLKNLMFLAYDESPIKSGATMGGTSVVWYDIGAQLADKALKVLNGTKPGDLPWEYPRKYNIILNLATAKQMGVEFPKNLVNAAYRVYSDYEGNFAGKAK